jgi:hypothetical protein
MTQRGIKRELAVLHYALVHRLDGRGPWCTKTRCVPLAETLTPWERSRYQAMLTGPKWCQDHADQADHRSAVREDADHIRAPSDLAVEALLGVGPDLRPDASLKERVHVGSRPCSLWELRLSGGTCRPPRRHSSSSS